MKKNKMLELHINFEDVFEYNDALSIDVEREREFQIQLKQAQANPVSLV